MHPASEQSKDERSCFNKNLEPKMLGNAPAHAASTPKNVSCSLLEPERGDGEAKTKASRSPISSSLKSAIANDLLRSVPTIFAYPTAKAAIAVQIEFFYPPRRKPRTPFLV